MSKAKEDYNKAYRDEYYSFSECEEVLGKGEIYIKELEKKDEEKLKVLKEVKAYLEQYIDIIDGWQAVLMDQVNEVINE